MHPGPEPVLHVVLGLPLASALSYMQIGSAKASDVQALASAILAPSLRHVADSLSLSWRRQLTSVAHKRYLKRINFYTVSQLAGMQVGF